MMELPAVLIIDMLRDNFDEAKGWSITAEAKAIVAPINSLTAAFRRQGWPVVFATDAYHADDFMFRGSMQPHAIAGTRGAEVVDNLKRDARDHWLPKPRFSAFFNTDLDAWLRRRQVTLCAVCGIATPYCVLTTALDALCHDFKTILVEDCCAAASAGVHRRTLSIYRRNPLYPLFRVLTRRELISQLHQDRPAAP